jgi:hypothetical protein
MVDLGIKKDGEGFYDTSARALQSAATPLSQVVKDDNSNFVYNGNAFTIMVHLRKEAKLQGAVSVKFWACNQGCYDKLFLEQGGADVDFFGLNHVNGVLDARLDVLHFEVGIVVSEDGVEWNALANQFQNVLDCDAGAGHTGFSKMNVRADLDSILHVDRPAACPSFALNAMWTVFLRHICSEYL